jgi:DNA-binding transcriptional LysR family regulator
MPYGIQQPAVSGQIRQLEKDLRVELFQRRPFALTHTGRDLFETIAPFFNLLPELRARLLAETRHRLRLGASATILRSYFPALLEQLKRRIPRLKLTLHDINHANAEELLLLRKIDLAITELDTKRSPRLTSLELLKLPLVFLAPRTIHHRRADEILRKSAGEETLISLPITEVIARRFQERLAALDLQWPIGIEVTSLDLVERYSAAGFGIGLSVALPHSKPVPELRRLVLRDCSPVVVAALWQGQLSEVAASFLDLIRTAAKKLKAK